MIANIAKFVKTQLCVANLIVCACLGFCLFFVFAHIVSLLEATANLSQFSLTLLKSWRLLKSSCFLELSNWQKKSHTLANVTYQLLSLSKFSCGCVCRLGDSESLLYQPGVWCDWWSYRRSFGLCGGSSWGALVVAFMAPLSKPLQERLHNWYKKYCVLYSMITVRYTEFVPGTGLCIGGLQIYRLCRNI